MDGPAGVVLAGGASTRIGRDKALLRLAPGAPTFLETAVAALRSTCTAILVVAPAERRYAVGGARLIPDRWPGAGPLGGILTAFEELGGGRAIVLACDYPLVTSDVVRALASRELHCTAVVPIAPGVDGRDREHPLVARYDIHPWRDLARTAFASGERSLRGWLALGAPCLLDLAGEAELAAALLNVNSPEDLERARVAWMRRG
jgi:molybdopterin-guanine dinucleotide biosynthesis protein A